MLSAWNFPNLIEQVSFTSDLTFNFILCVEDKIRDCICTSFPQSRSSSRYTKCLQNIRWATCEHFNTMSLNECDQTNQPIQSCYVFSFLVFYFIFCHYSFLKKNIILRWTKNENSTWCTLFSKSKIFHH